MTYCNEAAALIKNSNGRIAGNLSELVHGHSQDSFSQFQAHKSGYETDEPAYETPQGGVALQ